MISKRRENLAISNLWDGKENSNDNKIKRVALGNCQNIEERRGFPTGQKCSNTILHLAKNDRRWRGLSFVLGLLGMWFPKRRRRGAKSGLWLYDAWKEQRDAPPETPSSENTR